MKDLDKIKVQKKLQKEERIKNYINDIQNPYSFQCNGMKVNLEFHHSATLDDILTDLLVSKL